MIMIYSNKLNPLSAHIISGSMHMPTLKRFVDNGLERKLDLKSVRKRTMIDPKMYKYLIAISELIVIL